MQVKRPATIHFPRFPDRASLVTNELAQNKSRIYKTKIEKSSFIQMSYAFRSTVKLQITGLNSKNKINIYIYLSLKSMMKFLLLSKVQVPCIIMWVVWESLRFQAVSSGLLFWTLYCNVLYKNFEDITEE